MKSIAPTMKLPGFNASQLISLFIYMSGAVLLALSLDRLIIAVSPAQFMSLPEPVMAIPLRYAVLLVGAFELVVALICLFGRRAGLQLGWIAWLATNYLVYRIGLLTMHCHQQGTCIGSLTDPLCMTSGVAGIITSVAPVYLLLGSCVSLAWIGFAAQKFEGWRKEKTESIKMSCPACGRHIKFTSANLGQKIPCPQCETVIRLRKPEETLKISCFFCKEHIEFPSHAIGEKMPCPHCKMDITLKEPA